MTNEKQIEILMNDNCTRSEAKKHLQRGTIIFEASEFEKNLDAYIKEWDCDDFQILELQEMIKTKKPCRDWGVAKVDGITYFIEYVL